PQPITELVMRIEATRRLILRSDFSYAIIFPLLNLLYNDSRSKSICQIQERMKGDFPEEFYRLLMGFTDKILLMSIVGDRGLSGSPESFLRRVLVEKGIMTEERLQDCLKEREESAPLILLLCEGLRLMADS
ncbi:MAG: hypothetical protein N2234_10400, partial [Planctomycetota bacterium]|nr:hypothetical protein [Planctomycetota bacterium]